MNQSKNRDKLKEDPTGWLNEVLGQFDCRTGTLHRADGHEFLDLLAQVGVPEELMPVITRIPFGKGMAGAAAANREPVELCNLQQDLGGVAKVGARKTGVAGSLAVPIISTDGSHVVGTLGIGKFTPHNFTEEEKQQLATVAAGVAQCWEASE